MIDKNPVVGRHLFSAPLHDGALATYLGKIVAISGQRISYQDGSRVSWILVKSVRAVCDTDDEVERLKDLSNEAFRQSLATTLTFKERWNALVEGPL